MKKSDFSLQSRVHFAVIGGPLRFSERTKRNRFRITIGIVCWPSWVWVGVTNGDFDLDFMQLIQSGGEHEYVSLWLPFVTYFERGM